MSRRKKKKKKEIKRRKRIIMKKNLFKKAIVAVAVAALAVGTLAGCKNTADSKESQTDASGNVVSTFDTSKEITVISREEGSGTRGAFVEIVGVEQKDADGNKVDYTTTEAVISSSTNEVLTAVAGDEYAIGYISLGSLNDTVKAVKVGGVEATAENVANGTYETARPFNIATNGEASEAAQDFINFILSSDGQKIVEDNGYVAVSDAAAFESNGATGSLVVGGSSSVSPVMEKLIEAYQAVSEIEIELQTSDSSTGMEKAEDGSYDIGMASRELKDTETGAGLVPVTIAMDGIAIVVNTDNTTEGLTTEQICKIFTGDVTTWEEATK